MQVSNDNIYNLLSANMVYKIPRYQRQYSWHQSPQCETLWNDVKTIIEQNVAQEQTNHFLGTIVTVELQDSDGPGFDFVASSHLIDGQQRVTSFSLMIIALRHYVHKQWELDPDNEGLKHFEDTLSGLLERKAGKAKLALSSADQDAYVSLLKDGDQIESKSTTDDTLLLKNCRYFYKCWKALFDSKKSNVNLALTEQAIKPMFECLQFAHIKLEPKNNDNPQQVFESLNSTGMNLSQADLIRNFLLMDMNIDHQRELYEEYWRAIELNIENYAKDIQSVPDSLLQFFFNFLTVQNADIPIADAIYTKFKDWYGRYYSDKPNAHETCLKELLAANKVWCAMYWSKGDSSSEIERICYELRQLGRDVLNPVMFMFLYDYHCGRISEQSLRWCLKFLCSYCLRLFTQNEGVGNLMNTSFCRLMVKLKKASNDESYLQTLVEHLCQSAEEGVTTSRTKVKLKCPNDSDFRNWLINHSITSTSQEKQYIKVMLFVTERFENKEFALLPEAYALDFILPSDLTTKKGELSSDQGWDEKLVELSGHQEWYGRLGNLTLHKDKPLSKTVAKWSSFKDRKDEFGQNYKRHLNKELQGDKVTWTVQDIKERGERLADLILKVLPYPDMSLVK